ncbi:MAG: hypothetical protein H0X33_01745 [Taibaiella sp.]|nr:hypothetical protein [Taibaiella sp.]
MKQLFVVIITASVLLTACGGKERSLRSSVMHAKVDSLVGVKMQDINAQLMEDLDHRISIEVKAKADSIVAARAHPMDTTKRAMPTPMPRPLPLIRH